MGGDKEIVGYIEEYDKDIDTDTDTDEEVFRYWLKD